MEFLEDITDPFEVFAEWYLAAQNCGLSEPTAMQLATATKAGLPSLRTILLKNYNENGFCFYTNFNSRKGSELKENPNAALLFYWMPLKRQIRIEGKVEEVTAKEADEYFNSRHPESRIGAWASAQSAKLNSRAELLEKFAEYRNKLYHNSKPVEFGENIDPSYKSADVAIPRPPHWSGFRLVPSYFEFWEEGKFRLHNRRVYFRSGGSWNSNSLNP